MCEAVDSSPSIAFSADHLPDQVDDYSGLNNFTWTSWTLSVSDFVEAWAVLDEWSVVLSLEAYAFLLISAKTANEIIFFMLWVL